MPADTKFKLLFIKQPREDVSQCPLIKKLHINIKIFKLHVCCANCHWEFFYTVQKHSEERTSFVLELKYNICLSKRSFPAF